MQNEHGKKIKAGPKNLFRNLSTNWRETFLLILLTNITC